MDVRSIPLEELLPPLYPVRRVADDEKMAELVRSIQVNGLLHPLVVIPEDGAYRILAGHRRFIAISGLGWEEAPCNVVEMGPIQRHTVTIQENETREEVNPVDTGWYLRYLCENKGMTTRQISELLHKSQSWIAQRVRLTQLEEPMQMLVQEGRLPWRGALRLASIEDPHTREVYTRDAVVQRKSLHNIEAAVSQVDRDPTLVAEAIETAQRVREELIANREELRCFGCDTSYRDRTGDNVWLCLGCQRAIEEAKAREATARE